MKDLYLMRHGQTFFNQEGLVQGVCDSPLTDLGIEQAKQARAFFEKMALNLAVSILPLKRGLLIPWKL